MIASCSTKSHVHCGIFFVSLGGCHHQDNWNDGTVMQGNKTSPRAIQRGYNVLLCIRHELRFKIGPQKKKLLIFFVPLPIFAYTSSSLVLAHGLLQPTGQAFTPLVLPLVLTETSILDESAPTLLQALATPTFSQNRIHSIFVLQPLAASTPPWRQASTRIDVSTKETHTSLGVIVRDI